MPTKRNLFIFHRYSKVKGSTEGRVGTREPGRIKPQLRTVAGIRETPIPCGKPVREPLPVNREDEIGETPLLLSYGENVKCLDGSLCEQRHFRSVSCGALLSKHTSIGIGITRWPAAAP